MRCEICTVFIFTSFRVCFTYLSYILICIAAAKIYLDDYCIRHFKPYFWFSGRFVFLCLVAMLDEDEEDRVDETALQQLTEMGFPESRAIKALRLNQ